jgi:molybdate transport system regulatory protein
MKTGEKTKNIRPGSTISLTKERHHGRIVSGPNQDQCLNTDQLNLMECSFREWVECSSRADILLSRQRILIIFLLIRYAGAKLNEVLALNLSKDIDFIRHAVFFHNTGLSEEAGVREVQLAESLSRELKGILADPSFQNATTYSLDIDPGFVRRKFYERARSCGLEKRLGGPEMIRKARAVELMQRNMPLPAVQKILGHSTPNLTSSYVSFSEDEIQRVARLFMERESMRRTSARNSFFGKISHILKGDVQTRVDLATVDGHSISAIITNDSSDHLGLKRGLLITGEVKAPSVLLYAGKAVPLCSAENKFLGKLTKITKGKINTECVVRISDSTELCAILATQEFQNNPLLEGDDVWVLFSCFAVVLRLD